MNSSFSSFYNVAQRCYYQTAFDIAEQMTDTNWLISSNTLSNCGNKPLKNLFCSSRPLRKKSNFKTKINIEWYMEKVKIHKDIILLACLSNIILARLQNTLHLTQIILNNN